MAGKRRRRRERERVEMRLENEKRKRIFFFFAKAHLLRNSAFIFFSLLSSSSSQIELPRFLSPRSTPSTSAPYLRLSPLFSAAEADAMAKSDAASGIKICCIGAGYVGGEREEKT